MRKQKEGFLAGFRSRKELQKEIIEKFGEEAILKAKLRLCVNCEQSDCFLLPICSDGKDCPYFKQREKEG